MDPRFRSALATAAASCLAIFLGAEIAQGSYLWPALTGTVIIAAVLIRLLGLAADVILLGLVVVGYLVGNRGFAQLMPAPGLPLLPAEAALLVGCSWCLVECAFRRTLPFQRDALNWAVLALLVAGTVRVVFDVPRYGFNAVRDYATIYYAVFFFLVQHMARKPEVRRYLRGCLLFGLVALGPMFALFLAFDSFFLSKLVVAGTPLIYFKADLAATHLAAGSFILFFWARGLQRWWAWPLSLGITLFLLAFDSRSSLVGAIFASLLLLVAGRWRLPALQGLVATVALFTTIILSVVFGSSWADRKLSGLRDRVSSIMDVGGLRRYQSEESFNKGDNNRFRLVWWKNVIEETSDTNPVFGLGFGADMARGFVQEYYPDSGEEFNTRSPHNIFITFYGRLGATGLCIWTGFCIVLLARTWRVLRSEADPAAGGLWCGAWVVLVSATFGVVLEGPMGAVIFWTLLGLASASSDPTARPEAKAVPEAAAPAELTPA